jgi:phosphoribosyl-ATP pyrophosphohydrolase/phosphoribosyl-AMP cyclohydrolase
MNDRKIDLQKLDWNKGDGLIPVIIQDSVTLQVLMLGYMNKDACMQTCDTGKVTFYSRTKQRLWTKGETSGNYLMLASIYSDCDNDTLLVQVQPVGSCCHLDLPDCFGQPPKVNTLANLEKVIEQRYTERPENSYLSKLFAGGTQKIAQKVGEEGVEVALAAVSASKEHLVSEAADLLFHLLVLLKQCHIRLLDVLDELQKRMRA